MRIIAVVPTFNEENKIVSTIEALNSLPEITEIIVADDDSSDRTVEKALETKASVIKHAKNIGKGESLNAVLKKLDKTTCDGVILADGDLGKSASEFKRLIDNFEKNKRLLIVAGFGRPQKKGGIGLVKGLARWAIKRQGGEYVQTPLSGQRLFSVELLDKILPLASGFGVEVDMSIKALKSGFQVKEVETTMTHNETGRDVAGIMHRARQFMDVLKAVLRSGYSKNSGELN